MYIVKQYNHTVIDSFFTLNFRLCHNYPCFVILGPCVLLPVDTSAAYVVHVFVYECNGVTPFARGRKIHDKYTCTTRSISAASGKITHRLEYQHKMCPYKILLKIHVVTIIQRSPSSADTGFFYKRVILYCFIVNKIITFFYTTFKSDN